MKLDSVLQDAANIQPKPQKSPPKNTQQNTPQTWSVQIGAYKSKNKTNEALQYAKGKLPAEFSFVNPVSLPLNTNKGTVYRARLGGMTQAQARKICQYFHDCITVAPINTKTVGQ